MGHVFLKVRLEKGGAGGLYRHSRGLYSLMEYKSPFLPLGDEAWLPEADLYETRDEYVVRLNVAGVPKERLDVTLYEDYLKVSGRRVLEPDGVEVTQYHKLEMRQGYFERRFRLPKDWDRGPIEALLSDGILNIKLKKRGMESIDVES